MRIATSILPDLARGCAVLGAGGGGDPLIGSMMALQAIEDHGEVELASLDDLPDDGLLMPCGMIGAPTVSIEKIGNGAEGRHLRDRVEQLCGKPVVALMAAEIGGSNGMVPIAWAADLGIPVVDADGMGRAFPEVQQVTMYLAGISPNPCVMTDERGNTLVIETIGGRWLERIARVVATEFGARASSAEYLLTVAQARQGGAVQGSVSLAAKIGQTIGEAEDDPVAALLDLVRGFRLIEGKVVDIERRTTGGFARATALFEGLGADLGRTLRLQIQNENLVARDGERIVASTPDLITVLDTQSCDAIATERLRYGQRVTVIAFPCDPVWRTEIGLATAGPRAFAYDFDYVPVEELHAPA
ncbi:MAG: DUF917 domain-containing protein [Gaiellaceae bacterium]